MKAIAVVGSPRKGGNTEILAQHTLKSIQEEGVDTELISLAGLDIRPCTACNACRKEECCSINDDLFPIYQKLKGADAIILASPVYYGSASGLMKCFMERVGYIGGPRRVFAGKVGGLWWLPGAPGRISLMLSSRSGSRLPGSSSPVQPTGIWRLPAISAIS